MILLHFKEGQKDGSVPASVQLTRMKQIRWSKALLIQQVLIHRRFCDKALVGVTPDYCCPPGVKSISYTPQSLILRYKELCWSEMIDYTELALNVWYLVYKKLNTKEEGLLLTAACMRYDCRLKQSERWSCDNVFEIPDLSARW